MQFAQFNALSLTWVTLIFLYSCSSKAPDEVVEAYQNLPDKIDFNLHVQAILSDNCYACHGPDENARKADLRLDRQEEAFSRLKGGKSFAFKAGKPYESEAIKRILSSDPDYQMPTPESKLNLSPRQKAILIKWLEQGGEWKTHWAFNPPQKAELPSVQAKDLIKNEIDHFVLSKLERKGETFSKQADKATLLRRVSLDLIGLPPTTEQVQAFLNDPSSNAFEKMVDRLLENPQFGERMAWDWCDAARYADTNGFQADPERKMWPWRDWVIKAFNENMPFDQFSIEQLAGDLLPEANQDQVLATAFNRNHMYNGEGGRIPEETRVENVFDRVETTGTIWLGLTFNCARCHDHKFDPISQKEYYQIYDYFNQTSEKGLNGGGAIPPYLDLSPPLEQTKLEELNRFVEKLGAEVALFEKDFFPRESNLPAAKSPKAKDLDGDNLFALTFAPKDRNTYLLSLLYRFYQNRSPDYAQLISKLRKAMGDRNKQASQNLLVMVMDERKEGRPTLILDRGIYDMPKDSLEIFGNVPEVLPAPIVHTKNRLELAMWLFQKNHPLTARVTVNRYWQMLFGQGIVKTPDDFGVQGKKPTHPELLDWLAVEFQQSNWNVKALLKKMVMSATYQQSSKVSEALLEKDPNNDLLGRAPRYRLPSWILRDQALFIAGLLNDTIGGEPVKPYQPQGIWAEATFGKKKYKQDHGAALYRRTLYTFWRRIVGPTMLFDNSARQVCSVNPILTNSPQHALTTLNDITYLEAARVMAERVLTQFNTEEQQLDYAFQLATSRLPNETEKSILRQQVQKFNQKFEADSNAAIELISVGEYRQNPSLDPIAQATYTALCSMILNLDETMNRQ